MPRRRILLRETRLLDAADEGLTALKDACIAARAEVEDPKERPARQKKLRELRTWTDDDGMLAGRFRLTPEVGGQFLATLEKETQRIFRVAPLGQRSRAAFGVRG